ncbi:MAG: GHKL domain-containing protein [Clostridiales bacterium]|nr:GHKL domain-containing protein [Clostridiales bacterium]
MIFVIAVMLSVLAVPLAIAVILRVQEAEQEKALTQAYISSMEELCMDLQERTVLSRRYYHDLSKHIRVLEAMTGHPQRLQTGAEERLDSSYTHNEVLNAILISKANACQSRGIPFVVNVEDQAYEWIRDTDLAALLQNLLDNAVEAQERMSERENRGIWLSMGQEDAVFWIELCNRISPGERMDFQTKKEKASEHGIGMKIIQSLVLKYNGQRQTTVDEEKHLLNIRIEFPVPEITAKISSETTGEEGA